MNPRPNKKTDKSPAEKLRSAGPLLGIGTQLAATMVVFVLVGKYIDDKNNTHPLWLLIFALLGIAVGMYHFIKTIIMINKKPPGK